MKKDFNGKTLIAKIDNPIGIRALKGTLFIIENEKLLIKDAPQNSWAWESEDIETYFNVLEDFNYEIV